jgi:type IV pilus assembly protein PilB
MLSTAVNTNEQVAKILERQKILPKNVLDGLVNRARTLQEWIGQVAVDDGLLTYEELALAISREINVPLVNLHLETPEYSAIQLISVDICREYDIIPVRINKDVLTIAMANPFDESIMALLSNLVEYEIHKKIAPLDSIHEAVETCYAKLKTQKPSISETNNDTNVDVIAKIFADLAPNTSCYAESSPYNGSTNRFPKCGPT